MGKQRTDWEMLLTIPFSQKCFSLCSNTRLLKVKLKTALAVLEEPAATLVKLKRFNF